MENYFCATSCDLFFSSAKDNESIAVWLVRVGSFELSSYSGMDHCVSSNKLQWQFVRVVLSFNENKIINKIIDEQDMI